MNVKKVLEQRRRPSDYTAI